MAGILRNISPKSYENVDKELGGCKASGVPKAEFRRGGKGVVWEDGHGVCLPALVIFAAFFLKGEAFLVAGDLRVCDFGWPQGMGECLSMRRWMSFLTPPAQGEHETPVVKKKMEIHTGDSSELPPPDPYRANAA